MLCRVPRRAPVRAPVRALVPAVSLLLCSALAACGGNPGRYEPTGVDELTIPTPSPDPDDFVEGVDNPWLPLRPGSRWVYRADGEAGARTVTVSVVPETREVAGVEATVVREVVRDADGRLLEEARTWFAQDRAGNVWHLGEQATSYDGGGTVSWRAGAAGAQAGLAMPAEPRVGDGFRREHLAGRAEDVARVVALDGSASVPYGDLEGLLVLERTTPLDPGLRELEHWAEGVGLVREETVAGGDEVVELVSFSR